MRIGLILVIITCFWTLGTLADEKQATPPSLEATLKRAYGSNPEIGAVEAQVDAERAAVRSQSFLDDLHIGFMHENNMNFMELQQGPMNSLSISQQIKFPAKYFLLNRAQNAKASQAEEMAKQKKLEVRARVVSTYYNLFAVERVLTLLSAQRESLREIARTAEARYATGNVPQQDEMKAHVEQTQLEKDILIVEEEKNSAQAMLDAALGQDTTTPVSFGKDEMPVPKITADLAELPKMVEHHSKHIAEAKAMVDESDALKSLAYMSYAPDFNLSYRHAIGTYAVQNAYTAAVEISFPLWFFAKQSGEVGAATARANEAERKLEATKLDHIAEVRSLTAKVQSNQRILEVYRTGLIPQAESALNSSRASYRAGRSSIIDLLDSERSLYAVRIAYYRELAQFSEQVTKLEAILGQSVSTLPFGDAL